MHDYHPIGDAFSLRRSIGNGFLAVRLATGPMWLGGFLMSISDGCGNVPTSLPDLPDTGDDGSSLFTLPGRWPALAFGLAPSDFTADELFGLVVGIVVAVAVAMLLVGVALYALNSWLQTGFVRLHVNILERASDELGPLFSGRDRFWHMAGYKLLSGLIVSGTAIAAAWPGALLAYFGYVSDRSTLLIGGIGAMLILAVPPLVYVWLGVYLGELAVALDGASPVHALRRSWSLAHGNRMPLLGFAVVCLLIQFVSLAGVLLCCVGLLATVPLARALTGFAKTESYLLFTRGTAQAEAWRLWQRQLEEDRPSPVPAA